MHEGKRKWQKKSERNLLSVPRNNNDNNNIIIIIAFDESANKMATRVHHMNLEESVGEVVATRVYLVY